MAKAFKLKPTHKAVKTYYTALETYADHSVEHEGALRSDFQNLLADNDHRKGCYGEAKTTNERHLDDERCQSQAPGW